MKKVIALLLALAMAVSMAACSKGEDTDAPEISGGSEEAKLENKLIYGSDSALEGSFTNGLVESSDADLLVSELINDYTTMVTNAYGQYVENSAVLESRKRTENSDGTVTYTMQIRKGLVYNNGDAIKAKDFAVRLMLECSQAASALGISATAQEWIQGGWAYKNGETDYISGIRILDDTTLSLTVNQEYADYYYVDTYTSLLCWDPGYWLGEDWDVADEGQGAAFAYKGNICQLDGSAVAEHFRAAAMGNNGKFISAGPYNLESYDAESGQATLKINPMYQGDFQGQMPSIRLLVITRVKPDGWADDLVNGRLHVYEGISNGDDINMVLDLTEGSQMLQCVQYDRAGYGKLQFFCDVTPTQFVEVRRAIAMLLDRVAFADSYCKGWGSTVNGPYAVSMYQYQENKDLLAATLNPYDYDVDAAIQELEAGGWVLNAQGGNYTEGLRYKEVTQEQAKYMDECVRLEDGRILMPLIIKWCAYEQSDLSRQLAEVLVGAASVTEAGMQIRQDLMDWNGLINATYRIDDAGNAAKPFYSMVNQATVFDSHVYDYSYCWTDDAEYVEQGWNPCYLYDMEEGGLNDLSMRMVYGEVAGREALYLDLWADYVQRWNEMLPELPLYSNIHLTVLPTWVKGYEQSANWGFARAILYASIPGVN